jgi:hypothetical protein
VYWVRRRPSLIHPALTWLGSCVRVFSYTSRYHVWHVLASQPSIARAQRRLTWTQSVAAMMSSSPPSRTQPFARVLLALFTLLISSCKAQVTWTQIGCGGLTFKGTSLDDMWNNAKLQASNANTQIDNIINAKSIKNLTPNSNIADNAVWMFNTDYKAGSSYPSASASYLQNNIKPVYLAVQNQLAGHNGFLICNDNLAQFGPIAGRESFHIR